MLRTEIFRETQAPETDLGRFRPDGRGGPIMAMVEITQRCDLDCPICYAGSGPSRGPSRPDLDIEQFDRALAQIIATGNGPIPLQISGGEPSLHPELPRFVELARDRGFEHVEVVTNGVRICERPELARDLADRGLKALYLQFDGLRPETHRAIRGRDLRVVRTGAIEAARRAGLCVTLAVTVARGVNEHELGEVVQFATRRLETIRAVNFQAATPFGGRFGVDAAHFGLAELVGLIREQTGLPRSAFVSRGLGHPTCNALCLAYPDAAKPGGLAPLFSGLGEAMIERLLGEDPRRTVIELFRGRSAFLRGRLGGPAGMALISRGATSLGTNVLRTILGPPLILFAKSFQPGPALCAERLGECCYGLATPEGVWSFCAYNHQHRFPRQGTHPCAG
jgi:hypothetical protein